MEFEYADKLRSCIRNVVSAVVSSQHFEYQCEWFFDRRECDWSRFSVISLFPYCFDYVLNVVVVVAVDISSFCYFLHSCMRCILLFFRCCSWLCFGFSYGLSNGRRCCYLLSYHTKRNCSSSRKNAFKRSFFHTRLLYRRDTMSSKPDCTIKLSDTNACDSA